MRRRKQGTEVPPVEEMIQLRDGSLVSFHVYGSDGNVRGLALRPTGLIPARIGATVTFEVVGIERDGWEGQRA